MPENKPQKEPSGEIEFHATASPVVEPDEDTTEDNLIRTIRQVVREEFATVGIAGKAGTAGPEGAPGAAGVDGEDGEDGPPGPPGSADITAGAGLDKSGNILSVDLEAAGAADGGLELNDAGQQNDKTVRVKISETYGLKLTANGVELKFDSDQFTIDGTNGLQLKIKGSDLLEFDGSNGLATKFAKCS